MKNRFKIRSKALWFFTVMILFGACSLQKRTVEPAFKTHDSGIQYRISHHGEGEKVKTNDLVLVHYMLMLEDSTVIEDSRQRGEPVSFKVGAGHVIKGWDKGITLLRKGDKATLVVPPQLGYGDQPMGNIPAHATLVFHVEIMDVVTSPDPYQLDESVEIRETSAGLRFAVIEPGDGPRVQHGMAVRVHYSGYFEDFTIFDSSYERGEPIEFIIGRGMVIRGWEEGISRLHEGDKARLWIPYQLAYGEQGRGPIPPRSNLIFDVEVLQATEIKRPVPYPVDGLDTLTTESGLQYIIVEEGFGESPHAGQMVAVHYSGFLLNGHMFDSSVERGQPFRFVLGQGQVIQGWDEGVALMKPGAKYQFIIPPHLAYGQRSVGPIPAGSTLVFNVELLHAE